MNAHVCVQSVRKSHTVKSIYIFITVAVILIYTSSIMKWEITLPAVCQCVCKENQIQNYRNKYDTQEIL